MKILEREGDERENFRAKTKLKKIDESGLTRNERVGPGPVNFRLCRIGSGLGITHPWPLTPLLLCLQFFN